MKRPKFQSIFEKKSDFCEKSSPLPVDGFVPGQAIKLSELVDRFVRGQRLNVHVNFTPGSNLLNVTDDEAKEIMKCDNMDDSLFPSTDVYDVVDVQREYQNQEIHKREFSERLRNNKAQQAPTPGEAKQASETPVDPAK